MAKSKKILAKTVQLYSGLDLIGSKLNVNHKEAELVIKPMGIWMTSKKTKRVILLPWSNVKGVEMLPGEDLGDETDES